jgi:hypothetical protein
MIIHNNSSKIQLFDNECYQYMENPDLILEADDIDESIQLNLAKYGCALVKYNLAKYKNSTRSVELYLLSLDIDYIKQVLAANPCIKYITQRRLYHDKDTSIKQLICKNPNLDESIILEVIEETVENPNRINHINSKKFTEWHPYYLESIARENKNLDENYLGNYLTWRVFFKKAI